MSEFANRKAGKATTDDPLATPVSVGELADVLGLGNSTDPLLPPLILTATGAIVTYLSKDLLTRNWKLTHWDWPVWGTMPWRNVGQARGEFRREIALPFATDAEVSLVSLYGEATTEYVNRGDAILLNNAYSVTTGEAPAIVAEYTAGFGGSDSDVPYEIRQAILMLAAFLYEHRGACDAMEAMKKSGAANMLTPWRKAEVLI